MSLSCNEDPFDGDSGTFTDTRDNKDYKWIRIGNQIWMAENLRYIPFICPRDSDCGIWVNGYEGITTGPAKSNAAYLAYGSLYDWTTAMESCPAGWVLPSDDDWKELELFLGMDPGEIDNDQWRGKDQNIDGKLKETGTYHWDTPNSNATNESGFTALPGGYRTAEIYNDSIQINGFCITGGNARFWTSTDCTDCAIIRMIIDLPYGVLWDFSYKNEGLSVRCIKIK